MCVLSVHVPVLIDAKKFENKPETCLKDTRR